MSLAHTPWPAEGLEQVPACPVCGIDDRVELHTALRDRVNYCAAGSWNLYRCLHCGAAYLDPRPTPASIHQAYASYYTHQEPLPLPLPTGRTPIRWLRRALRNGYINKRYGASLSPAIGIGEWIVPMFPVIRTNIDLALRFLPRISRQHRCVLDVGCGTGSFLREAVGLGWEGYGVDPDPKAVALNAGLSVELGGFPTLQFPDGRFDVVTLSHVIEHVHDPLDAMREVFRLLRPSGQVTIITPNLDSCAHRHFGGNWIGLHPPAHLVLFNRAAIADALVRVGFTDVKFRSVYGQTRGYFELSLRVRRGIRPFSTERVPMSFGHRMAALAAEIHAAAIPSRREEIVVTARRPR